MVEITYPWVLLVVLVPYLIYYFWPLEELSIDDIK